LAAEIQLQAAVLIGLIGFWSSSALALLGWQRLPTIALCSLLLLLVTPLPFLLVPWLRDLTVLVVTSTTKAVGIVAFIEGNLIQLATGTIEIADGCSGEKYLRSALIIATLSLLMRVNRFGPAPTLLAFVACALLANWIRVFVLVLIAHQTSTQNSIVMEHDWLGWIVFGVVMFALFWLGLGSRRTEKESHRSAGTEGRDLRPVNFLWMPLVIAALALIPALSVKLLGQPSNRITGFVPFEALAACRSDLGSPWSPVSSVLDAELEIRESLICETGHGRFQVYRYSAAFAAYERSHDLTAWGNSPAPTSRWNPYRTATVSIGKLGQGILREAMSRERSGRWLILSWHTAGSRHTPSPIAFKFTSLLKRSLGQYEESTTRIYFRCPKDCESAERTLLEIVGDYVHLEAEMNLTRPLPLAQLP
ncbi:MAG: archaeosortase/exosortase family protein, partial [Pseudomonadota bacterium]